MKKTTLLYLLLTAAVLFWLWTRLSGSEESRIRRQLERIDELVEKSPGEGALDGVGRARSFAELFAEPFEAEVAPAGQRLGDKPQLMQLFVAFRHSAESIDLDYRNLEIVVADNRREAVATFDALLNGGPAGFLAEEGYAVELRFRKVGGDWQIARARVDNAVRRGGR